MATYDYFSIGTEFDSSWGNSTQSKTVLPFPENVRDMPCDGCSKAYSCEVKLTECSAFRNWSGTGNYMNTDVQRFIRAIKN
jgi:hypothetical protein